MAGRSAQFHATPTVGVLFMTLIPNTNHKVYTVASGKGGVGKTSFTLNLATQLAKSGKKVLVMDGDTGLANLDIQLNIQPERDLAHYIHGQFALRNILTSTPQGFSFIAGRSGTHGLIHLPMPKISQLLNDLRELSKNYDITLIDAPAGIAPQTLQLCAQSDATLLLTTPDPSSLTDAYALIKLLWADNATANSLLIVNQASATEAKQVHTRLTTAAEKFLGLPPIIQLGHIPSCRQYATAVRQHQLVSIMFPNSPAIQAIQTLAHKIL